MSILVDTNFVFALFDKRDRYHSDSVTYFSVLEEDLLFPTIILAEVTYHLHGAKNNQDVAQIIKDLMEPPFVWVDSTDADYQRATAILEKYHDTRIDFVDACIMAMAERLGVTRILTFDHRDFGVYRPSHAERFDLLP